MLLSVGGLLLYPLPLAAGVQTPGTSEDVHSIGQLRPVSLAIMRVCYTSSVPFES
jgi:hypothetical protein